MAEAVVGEISSELLDLVVAEFHVDRVLKSKIDAIVDRIRFVNGVLDDADERQSHSYVLQVWLRKLKTVFHEADNLLDEFGYQILRRKVLSNSQDQRQFEFVIKRVGAGLSLVKQPRKFSVPPGAKCRTVELKKSLDGISGEIETFGLKYQEGIYRLPTEKEQSYSFVPEEEVIGRDDDKKNIVEKLFDSSAVPAGDKVSVVAVVGLGGLGKTTLAQLVFNDEKISKYFQHRMWVCVSHIRKYGDILRKIVDSSVYGQSRLDSSSEEQLESQVLREIEGRLYLLVLDDLRTEDKDDWDRLKQVLNKGAKGSKILVTTRSSPVAMMVEGSNKPYRLQGLSKESWSLFERVAFEPGEASGNPAKVKIGKKIVSKCGKVPLIIRMVASLLYGKSVEKWLEFTNEKFDIMDLFIRNKKDDLVDILRPSYDDLPRPVKLCFAYCSLFPKDYEFCKHDLIHLWMAQGFLLSSSDNFSLEDVGEDYFQQLLGRCFFQDAKNDSIDRIVSCRMPDMVNHLARNVAGTESIISHSNTTKIDDRSFHVSLRFDGEFPEGLFEASNIRSLLFLKDPECGAKLERSVCCTLLSKLQCLRALDLHDTGIDMLPDGIGTLIHLRYLDLSKNDSLMTLPDSITGLLYLQTLKLNFCTNLSKLPEGIGKLIMLRCLETDECDHLTYMPLGLGKLTSLQTLTQFVGCMPTSRQKGSGGLRVLSSLDKLQGKVKIEFSGNWDELVQEAPEARMSSKRNLTHLKIEWRLKGLNDNPTYQYYYEAMLEGLQPPSGLRLLCIQGYRGKDFPSWAKMDNLLSGLPNLVIINIEGCKESLFLPPFGKLMCLKCLTLRYMEGVEYVEIGTYDPASSSSPFFPSLKELTLHSFYNLKGWWKEARDTQQNVVLPFFPALSKLKIWNCPKLTSMPLFPGAEDIDFRNINQKLFDGSTKVELSTPSASSVLLQNLYKLKRFQIKGCPNMKKFPTVGDVSKGIHSIQFLVIDKCDTLTSLVDGLQHLKSLEELEISGCKELNFWDNEHRGTLPWSCLESLHYLTFRDIPKMTALPEGITHIKTLKSLSIVACNNLVKLPESINQISSLQHLRIEGCARLTSLPKTIRGLQNLVKLDIVECPKLIESLGDSNSNDRVNISHIPGLLLHKSWRYDLMNDTVIKKTYGRSKSMSLTRQGNHDQKSPSRFDIPKNGILGKPETSSPSSQTESVGNIMQSPNRSA